MEKKERRGRPSKPKIRNHQIRYGRLYDDLQLAMSQFESEKDKELIKDLLESLKPKKQSVHSDI